MRENSNRWKDLLKRMQILYPVKDECYYFVRKKKNTREVHNYERSSRKDNVSIMLVDFVTSVSRMTGKNMQGLILALV